jgi:hypothetical protein
MVSNFELLRDHVTRILKDTDVEIGSPTGVGNVVTVTPRSAVTKAHVEYITGKYRDNLRIVKNEHYSDSTRFAFEIVDSSPLL